MSRFYKYMACILMDTIAVINMDFLIPRTINLETSKQADDRSPPYAPIRLSSSVRISTASTPPAATNRDLPDLTRSIDIKVRELVVYKDILHGSDKMRTWLVGGRCGCRYGRMHEKRRM
jgi:hypothetical protein